MRRLRHPADMPLGFSTTPITKNSEAINHHVFAIGEPLGKRTGAAFSPSSHTFRGAGVPSLMTLRPASPRWRRPARNSLHAALHPMEVHLHRTGLRTASAAPTN